MLSNLSQLEPDVHVNKDFAIRIPNKMAVFAGAFFTDQKVPCSSGKIFTEVGSLAILLKKFSVLKPLISLFLSFKLHHDRWHLVRFPRRSIKHLNVAISGLCYFGFLDHLINFCHTISCVLFSAHSVFLHFSSCFAFQGDSSEHLSTV